MAALSFVVVGRPQPAGSKRGIPVRRHGQPTGQVAVIDANPHTKSWQGTVREAAHQALQADTPSGNGDTPIPYPDAPLTLIVDFYLRRPAGHYGTGRNHATLKPSAPRWPTTKPDATKLTRAVEDALTGIVWRDDSQVVAQLIRKHYARREQPEHAHIEIVDADQSFARHKC